MTGGRAILFVVVAVVVAIATLRFLSADRVPEPRGLETPIETALEVTPTPEPTETFEPRFATEVYVNDAAQYAFNYPPAWQLQTTGSVTKVSSPDESTVVTFGLGLPGSLEETASSFRQLLSQGYEKVRITGSDTTELDGAPAIEITGSGVNERGLRVAFRALAVEGQEDNYAITVFSTPRPLPGTVRAETEEILTSFGPAAAG